jgi:hypothetical protein
MEALSADSLLIPTELETLNWNIEPLYEDYRELPIEQGFNWPKLLAEVTETRGIDQSQYYLVCFRSTRKEGEAVAGRIEELDTAAYTEAKKSPALLHYFGGNADENGLAMSWCLWTDAESAREALMGNAHMEAVMAAPDLYKGMPIVECYDVLPYEEEGLVFRPIARHTN